MSEHVHRTIERHCDVVVIGGSADDLAAALQLAREGYSVIVVDAGDGGEGRDEREAAAAREEVRSHGVEVLAGRAVGATRTDGGGSRVELTGGTSIRAGHVRSERDDAGEVPAVATTSANEADWDHRYSGDQLWSGNPNGTLVVEITGMQPGRALDIGAGEGGDAIWLAEHGWSVTANDISQRALARVAAEAERRGLTVECDHSDANSPAAFGARQFDLVSAHYASIPRTHDGRGVRNMLAAVAPGGTILVVSHDLEPMRAPIDTSQQSRAFDPDAYVRVVDVAAAIAGSGDWEIEVDETRPRPPGAVSTHHVDDVVFRARRRPA